MDDCPFEIDDRVMARLRQEFLADTRERLDVVRHALAVVCGTGTSEDPLLTVRREAHNMKGMGSSSGFPTITMIAHRLEDYAAQLSRLSARNVQDIEVFLDHIQDIVERGADLGNEETIVLLRRLPARPDDIVDERPLREVEILLVTSTNALGRIVGQELRACGYRVTLTAGPCEALGLAVRARPDLIVASAELSPITGADLVRALRAMTATEGLPVAVLTSYGREHPALARLPAEVPTIRLGASLPDELARVLALTGIA